jgi:hypothetical protein
MIAGLSTLGGSYLFSALVGLTLLNYENDHPGEVCLNCEATGSALLIPIAGPWIALPDANEDKGGQVVCAILGLAQATGVVLSIVGIIQFTSSGRPAAAVQSEARRPSMTVGFAPMPGGGAMGALRAAF